MSSRQRPVEDPADLSRASWASTINGGLRWLGWMATFAMATCSIGMIVGWFF
jgi:hypothetical protein